MILFGCKVTKYMEHNNRWLMDLSSFSKLIFLLNIKQANHLQLNFIDLGWNFCASTDHDIAEETF
jgi:hypothetical protein